MQTDDYVCTDKLGNLLTPRYVTLRFSQVLEKNGMRHIRFHDLRHTFASVANSANVPLLDIGRALGHKDISITGRIYTHLFDETHSKVLKTVAGCIRNA